MLPVLPVQELVWPRELPVSKVEAGMKDRPDISFGLTEMPGLWPYPHVTRAVDKCTGGLAVNSRKTDSAGISLHWGQIG